MAYDIIIGDYQCLGDQYGDNCAQVMGTAALERLWDNKDWTDIRVTTIESNSYGGNFTGAGSRSFFLYTALGSGSSNSKWSALRRQVTGLDLTGLNPTTASIFVWHTHVGGRAFAQDFPCSMVLVDADIGPTCEKTDYDITYWTNTRWSDSTLDMSTVTTETWYEFPLNAHGLGKFGGVLQLGCRSVEDADNDEPVWPGALQGTGVNFKAVLVLDPVWVYIGGIHVDGIQCNTKEGAKSIAVKTDGISLK